MKTITIKHVVISCFVVGTIFLSACDKDKSGCYDKKLYEQHKDDACPDDCLHLTGCDGKHYCNECDARRNGIRID